MPHFINKITEIIVIIPIKCTHNMNNSELKAKSVSRYRTLQIYNRHQPFLFIKCFKRCGFECYSYILHAFIYLC